MGIKIGGGAISSIRYGELQNDYSAMQGPCPNGFHIPDKDEWEVLVDIGATIGAYVRGNSGTYTTAEYPFRQYFKIPRIAYFELSGALNVPGRFSFVCYLSCKNRYAVHVIASGGHIPSPIYNGTNTDGYPIRPFKDVPEIPDSSWTMLYDGSNTAVGAGIFYNSSLGLISASKDGVAWKTIADKDIGATNPYNQTDGSVQIDAVGHIFQWGNNYGHPYPDSVTTSSTQVDASNYGPGNYYNDSTWITTWPRDSSDNLDLWGGTTGIRQFQPEVKKVMMRPNNIETQIRPTAEHLPALSEWNWTADQSTTFGSRGQLSFGPDGTTISNGGVGNRTAYRGTCTTPYSLTNITNSQSMSINLGGGAWTSIGKVAWSEDGNYFIVGGNYCFVKYSVTTPFTFSGATQVQNVVVASSSSPGGYNEGRGFHVLWGGQYICGSNGVRGRMSTPYDLTTLQPTSAVNTTFITPEKADIFATQTGNEAYITVYGDNTIKRLTFQTPFDFSTVIVEESHSLGYHPQGVWYAKDGQNEYLFIGEGYGKIRRYVKA